MPEKQTWCEWGEKEHKERKIPVCIMVRVNIWFLGLSLSSWTPPSPNPQSKQIQESPLSGDPLSHHSLGKMCLWGCELKAPQGNLEGC